MKKILIFIAFTLFTIKGFGQDGAKEIRELDRANSYSDSIKIVTQESTSNAKFMTLDVAAPRIASGSYTETTVELDKDVIKMRYDEVGTEKVTTLRYINPSIHNYTTIGAVATTYWVGLNDLSDDYKISLANFMKYTNASNHLTTATTASSTDYLSINTGTSVDKSITLANFFNTLSANVVNKQDTSTVWGEDLKVGATSRGTLWITKAGKTATLMCQIVSTAGGTQTIDNYTMATDFRPLISVNIQSYTNASNNTIELKTDGTIYVTFATGAGNAPNLCGSYLTNYE